MPPPQWGYHTEEALFSRGLATEIWRFVLQHRSEIERILVHCDAGMSRSPAVATALSKILMGDDTPFFGSRFFPNRRVHRTLLDTYADCVEPPCRP